MQASLDKLVDKVNDFTGQALHLPITPQITASAIRTYLSKHRLMNYFGLDPATSHANFTTGGAEANITPRSSGPAASSA